MIRDWNWGFAHNNLGKLKTSLGLLADTETHYREDLQIKMDIAQEDPSNNLWREYLAYSHIWLGKLLAVQAKLTEATVQNKSALELLDKLLVNDPDLNRLQQRKAGVANPAGRDLQIERRSRMRIGNIESALAILADLTSQNPENAKWLGDRCWSELRQRGRPDTWPIRIGLQLYKECKNDGWTS